MKQIAIRISFFIIMTIQSLCYAQSDTAYSFIVAGHAYGAHSGTNIGLHPHLLSSLTDGYETNTAFIVLTGDIVNHSTSESWEQVETELNGYGLTSYYVMGNHDDNSIGYEVFENKHGGDYYAFTSQTELYIVLNSTESDRSISPAQLEFMQDQIDQADASIQNVFIFFHEVIWNSKEKYAEVRSNSRSRYVNMVDYSNYWEEVHPICTELPAKNFYMISGDVGGNPDAIAAFWDTCDNVTLISSGMGEVDDENYLLVKVLNKDSIVFELVPLLSDVDLDPIEYYSVPQAPDTILYTYPMTNANFSVEFSVPEVLNADTYIWHLPSMASGVSITNSITVDFEDGFLNGELSVRAARDGFGYSPMTTTFLEMNYNGTDLVNTDNETMQLEVFIANEQLTMHIGNIAGDQLHLRIYDITGKLILHRNLEHMGREVVVQLDKCDLPQGFNLVSLSTKNQNIARKIILP